MYGNWHKWRPRGAMHAGFNLTAIQDTTCRHLQECAARTWHRQCQNPESRSPEDGSDEKFQADSTRMNKHNMRVVPYTAVCLCA